MNDPTQPQTAAHPGEPPILILGGTAEARELAAALDAAGVPLITSLAGRVARPRLPPGQVRVGGFGGPQGLADWLRDQRVGMVIDATHPFAERISATVAAGCEQTGAALVRLERPGWTEVEGDRWHWTADLEGAAAALRGLARADGRHPRVLLTTGRQGLAAFAGIDDAWFLVRCVDPPSAPLPPRHELLLDRGPYTLQGELALIDGHAIDVVVTKDSGGDLTRAKLDAARERGLPVIVVRRPDRRLGSAAPATVTTIAQALRWVSEARDVV